jgi:hypothetical protein
MEKGIVYAFTLKERLFSARLHLEFLKREGYIEAYGKPLTNKREEPVRSGGARERNA